MLPYIRKRFNKVISFAAKERKSMKEEDLEDLGKREYYILSPKEKNYYYEHYYLLRNGEIVRGIRTPNRVDACCWMRRDGDTYLGIGVLHQ